LAGLRRFNHPNFEMMARGLDHIVHAVRDLDAAAALYRQLGFQVGACNRHAPNWGTQNRIVQFPGTFIELLSIADASGIAPHAPRSFAFGAFNRDFLARGEGLSMLVLEGRGAEEAAAFRTAGIGDFDTYDFEREGKRPDGSAVKVAFSLAFAADRHAPEVGFFTCLHRYPENFWTPAFQIHPNTASGVAGVVLVAENPADLHVFLEAFAGERDVHATSSGILLKTPRGTIEVMNPRAYADHFGVAPPDTSASARLAALRFSVGDFTAIEAILKNAAIPHASRLGQLIVGPDIAMGAALIVALK
jgi:hypothetical protein